MKILLRELEFDENSLNPTGIDALYVILPFLAEPWRAKRVCGALWVSKSTHPRKFGNHVTVHRPPVRPHHRKTSVQSHTF